MKGKSMTSKWANGNEVASRTGTWDWQVQCVFPWFSPFLGAVKSGGGGFPGGAVVKNPPANAGDMGLLPGLGRSHMPQSN